MDSNSKSDGLDDKMKSQIRNPDYLQWVHLLEDTIPLVMPKNRRQTVIQEEWTLEKVNLKEIALKIFVFNWHSQDMYQACFIRYPFIHKFIIDLIMLPRALLWMLGPRDN